MKILLAVDGSTPSLDAVKCLIEHADWYREKPAVDLLYVHPPLPKLPGVSKFIGKSQIQKYYQEEGEAALAKAKKLLEAAGMGHETHILVGSPAETICGHAKAAGCDLIFIGTHGRSDAANMLLGSAASKVLHLSSVPVLLVR